MDRRRQLSSCCLFQRTCDTKLPRRLRMWNAFKILENSVFDFPGESVLKQEAGNVLAYMRSTVMAGVGLALAIVATVDLYGLLQR